MATFLETKVVAEAIRASAKSGENVDLSEEQVPEMRFVEVDSVDVAANTTGDANTTMYDLTTLLSPEALGSIAEHASQEVSEGVWKVKGLHAWRMRLAIEKLQSYKASNEIQKQLPMAQNPVGTRQKKSSDLGALFKEGEEES